MELNLTVQPTDAVVTEVDGGGYYAWTPAKSPVLATAKLGAGKLVLQPRGFALPHYADSAKIGFVIQGVCTVGILQPGSRQEQILIIRQGDAIPVQLGAVSWWFNGGDADVIIVFLGETTRSYNPGMFDYFFLSGAIGLLAGFSSEFIEKAYNITEEEAQKLAKSQTSLVILKLDDQVAMPDQPNPEKSELYASLRPGELTAENFPLLKTVGLSASLTTLNPNAALSPTYTLDGSFRVVYVVKGSGKIQIVGLNGALALDAHVEEGQLFVVPGFFALAQIADGEGLEFFSVVTSSRPEIGELGGKVAAWKAISSSVVQASLNVDLKFVEFFKSKLLLREEDENDKKKKSQFASLIN